MGSLHTHQCPHEPFAQIEPGDQRADGEDQAHVDHHIGAHVPARVARAQVLDREQPAEHEAAQRDDRERDVHVEDLLQEALFGFEGRVEEHQPKRKRHRGDGGDAERSAGPVRRAGGGCGRGRWRGWRWHGSSP